MPPTDAHFALATQIAKKTGYTIYFTRYPLQKNHIITANHILKSFFTAQKDWNKTYKGNIDAVFGDSAGGTLTLFLATNLKKHEQAKKYIAFSPCADLQLKNKDADKLQDKDQLLPLKLFRQLLDKDVKNADPKNPIINYLYADFSRVTDLIIFASDRDILYADVLLLHKKLLNEKIKHKYIFYENMIHDWILFSFFIESQKAKKEIIDILNMHKD
jgi:acetyl esterase/lipase